jgi:hypothetical protein
MKPYHQLSRQAKWHRRQSIKFVAMGLTTNGKERQRRPDAENRIQRLAMRRERGIKAWNLRVQRLRKLGLTTRGTKPIYTVRRGDAILLRDQIDRAAAEINSAFDYLPPAGKVQMIRLASQLADIRKQLV